ncbi:hydroxymethylpyrimidine/phosphomethylpyrimidine kinase [bacterium]|nr:hydroxymethylpyrimidine/phosphomethylpyrimidine kinase [bacterium]
MKQRIICVIAGLDPTGCSGISADIRAISATGNIVSPVITAIANQGFDSAGKTHLVKPAVFAESLQYAFSTSTKPSSIKIGMLGSGNLVDTLCDSLESFSIGVPIVLDPVFHSTSCMELLDRNGIAILVKRLFPLTTLVTANWEEASILSGVEVSSEESAKCAGESISKSTNAVLIKGGHSSGEPRDFLFFGKCMYEFSSKRIAGRFRGTGCALASLIASNLAEGLSLPDSVSKAKSVLTSALKKSHPPYILYT